jgi:deoxyhypusine synthase
VRGYNFDVQIVSSPVTDGSLSSCFPAEAVTWGKVDKDTYTEATESMQADYSTLMPFLVKALLDNRTRYERRAEEIGLDAAIAEDSRAAGYLRPREGYRLYEQRERLTAVLRGAIQTNRDWLLETLSYPLA